jgi:putative (di)nucleoside polyphosphate hydrolase
MSGLELYRPNVGVVLFNPKGRVWLGRRSGVPEPYNWQFPQGGVDADEPLDAAAIRELYEETGVRSVTLLDSTAEWFAYDFPPEVQARGRWLGQKQAWYAFRFEGEESEIRLDIETPPEFDTWRWGGLHEAPDLVVPFKREAYRRVVDRFKPFAGD